MRELIVQLGFDKQLYRQGLNILCPNSFRSLYHADFQSARNDNLQRYSL